MIKILAVDDMEQWRSFHKNALNTLLKDVGFELTLADCAYEAFQVIQDNQDNPFDLIITDLQMELDFEPEHAGEWLVRNIQEMPKYRNTPIIIVSAAINIRFIAEKFNVDYLPKPSLIHNPLIYELKLKEILNR